MFILYPPSTSERVNAFFYFISFILSVLENPTLPYTTVKRDFVVLDFSRLHGLFDDVFTVDDTVWSLMWRGRY